MSRRYPLDPLFQLTGWTMNTVTRLAACNGSEYRIRRAFGVTEQTADRLAIAAGLHPWAVWPDMAVVATQEVLRRCAADGCDQMFLPHSRAPHALYCSPRCRQREKARRYRATEHGAETNRRHRRSYYAANSAYELAQKRREREARRGEVAA